MRCFLNLFSSCCVLIVVLINQSMIVLITHFNQPAFVSPDCEYGDRYKNCEDLVYPYACYHPVNALSCCARCGRYKNATRPGQSWSELCFRITHSSEKPENWLRNYKWADLFSVFCIITCQFLHVSNIWTGFFVWFFFQVLMKWYVVLQASMKWLVALLVQEKWLVRWLVEWLSVNLAQDISPEWSKRGEGGITIQGERERKPIWNLYRDWQSDQHSSP